MVKWKLQVVLTKCDLVERFELARRIQVIKQKVSPIFLISAAFIIVRDVVDKISCSILFYIRNALCSVK
jgi:hypothetical protein